VSALFALSAPESSVAFIFLAYFPAIIFWGLDGYFLWQERMYRDLYDQVRVLESNNITFSMDAKSASNKTWPDALLSKTLILFHGLLIGAIIVVTFITLFG